MSYSPIILNENRQIAIGGAFWTAQRRIGAEKYAIQQDGRKLRFEVRSGDGAVPGDTDRDRAELSSATKCEFGVPYWFAYSMKIGPGVATYYNIVTQFHNTPNVKGEPGKSPPFANEITPGEVIKWRRRYDNGAKTSIMYQRPVERKTWTPVVGRVVFTQDVVGASCNLWYRGRQVVNLKGMKMGYNDLRGPYMKFGIYRRRVPNSFIVEFQNLEFGIVSLESRILQPLPLAA